MSPTVHHTTQSTRPVKVPRKALTSTDRLPALSGPHRLAAQDPALSRLAHAQRALRSRSGSRLAHGWAVASCGLTSPESYPATSLVTGDGVTGRLEP
jgi:hypothetical protein